jgi:hypothetical protein
MSAIRWATSNLYQPLPNSAPTRWASDASLASRNRLFHSPEEAQDGVANWLGDEFGESTRLALLAVTVPSDAARSTGAGFETVLTEPVPPDRITIVSHDL